MKNKTLNDIRCELFNRESHINQIIENSKDSEFKIISTFRGMEMYNLEISRDKIIPFLKKIKKEISEEIEKILKKDK